MGGLLGRTQSATSDTITIDEKKKEENEEDIQDDTTSEKCKSEIEKRMKNRRIRGGKDRAERDKM